MSQEKYSRLRSTNKERGRPRERDEGHKDEGHKDEKKQFWTDEAKKREFMKK